jgi:Methyltransferase domain
MDIGARLRRIIRPRDLRAARLSSPSAHDVRPYLSAPDPATAVAAATNDMERIFYGHTGRQSFKWHHYLEAYDRHLERFRGTQVRLLEIGVQKGGSLQIWRKYFGRQAVIFGIDIDESCRDLDDADASVRIGSQGDAEFLKSVVAEMGGIDIVVDDGGHVAEHQRASFGTLFPMLSVGGVYLCEDLQTSYWEVYHNGGYQRPGTFIEFVKHLIDDMHAWYHDHPQVAYSDAASSIYCVSMYDGLAVIEKRPRRCGTFCGMPPDH